MLEPNHLKTSLFLQPIRYGYYNQLFGYPVVSKVYIPVCHDLLSNRKCHANMVQHVIASNLHFAVHIGQYPNMAVNMLADTGHASYACAKQLKQKQHSQLLKCHPHT